MPMTPAFRILLGAAGLALLVLVLDRMIDRMYRNPVRRRRVDLRKNGLPVEDVRIPAAGGGWLSGVFVAASPDAPVILLVHGWGRNIDRVAPYLRRLYPQGYNLLAFDARNHGDSSPVKHPTVGTFTEDILAAVDYLAARKPAFSGKVGVIGLSIGGAAAINAAGRDERIRSVVTVGAFSHPEAAMLAAFTKKGVPEFLPRLLFAYMRLRYGLDFDALAPVNAIRETSADVLLIHGEQDEIVPVGQGKQLADAGNPRHTRLWVVAGRGHSNCEKDAQFWERVLAFLRETLPAGGN